MELEQLRIFVAVAEAGSFSAAARGLFVSHSTTSRAVSALERELGAELLSRQGKTVVPTPAGEELLRRAKTLLQQAEETKAAVAAYQKQENRGENETP